MLSGSIVAIVTPMAADGGLDLPALKSLIDWHVAEGTDGIVIVGTTGESPTVDFDEHHRLIASAVEFAAGRVPVIAGAGGNATREAIELTRFAARAGADYILSVVPYYNKPTQEGLYRHFKAVAEASELPVLLYNVPSRTVADLANDTVLRLAELPRIVGIKESTSNIERVTDLMARMPKGFMVFSGNDDAALAYAQLGANGVISVTANVAPRLCAEMQKAWRDGRLGEAMAIQDRLLPLHDAMFCETSPGPVKYAASLLGKGTERCRLPLAPVAEAGKARVREAMVASGLLN